MHQERRWYRVDVLCRVLRVSRGGYYAWLHRQSGKRERADAALLHDIRRVHAQNKQTYGSPRVYRELRNQGKPVGKARVERLMRQNQITSVHRRKFKVTTDSSHKHPVATNVLAGRFEWKRPNQAWVGDITYVPTDEGWLYLAVLLDLFSRRVVGWSMDKRMNRELPLRALHMAVQRRCPPPGLIHHTDQGSQYASGDYQAALKAQGMVCSMSAKGRCYDNAVAESFFHSLKVELVHRYRFGSREHAMSEIFKYMEGFYNNQRMHSALDYRAPAQYEAAALLKAA